MSVIFMFPGQSSADPGMLARARSLGAPAEQVLAAAATVLAPATLARYTLPTGVPLETNSDVQLSVFLTTQMHLRALAAEGIEAERSLGLSLGEYSHLVHIGALSFEDALALIERRGAAYDRSPHGIMVVVLGATSDEVADVVSRASSRGAVSISNVNAPTQHVLAGERDAVEAAAALLEEECGATTVETESRVPMHSPLLAPVAAAFRADLAKAPWHPVHLPYLPNVSGALEQAPTPARFVDRLTAHVTEPVQWRASIEHLAAAQPDPFFIEVGPGSVLFNMLSRKWLEVRRAKTDDRDAATLGNQLSAVVRSVRGER